MKICQFVHLWSTKFLNEKLFKQWKFASLWSFEVENFMMWWVMKILMAEMKEFTVEAYCNSLKIFVY